MAFGPYGFGLCQLRLGWQDAPEWEVSAAQMLERLLEIPFLEAGQVAHANSQGFFQHCEPPTVAVIFAPLHHNKICRTMCLFAHVLVLKTHFSPSIISMYSGSWRAAIHARFAW